MKDIDIIHKVGKFRVWYMNGRLMAVFNIYNKKDKELFNKLETYLTEEERVQ